MITPPPATEQVCPAPRPRAATYDRCSPAPQVVDEALAGLLELLVEELALDGAAVVVLLQGRLVPMAACGDHRALAAGQEQLVERLPTSSDRVDLAVWGNEGPFNLFAQPLRYEGQVIGALVALRRDRGDQGAGARLQHWLQRAGLLAEGRLLPCVRTRQLGPAGRAASPQAQVRLDEPSVLDGRGHLREAGPDLCALLGQSAPDLVGRSLVDLVHPDDRQGLVAALALRALGPTPVTMELRLGPVQGAWPWVRATLVFDTSRNGLTLAFRDISHERRLERMQSEFVSMVSHELRTPLTSIRGALGLVLSGALGELPPQSVDLLDIASRNAVRLVRLVNDLLDVERIASGRLTFHMTEVDLVEVATEALDQIQPFAASYQVVLEPPDSGGPLLVNGDASRLRQVIDNLLANAVRYSPKGGTVSVRVLADVDAVSVEVEDRGAGIAPQDQPRIFGRFAQGSAARSSGQGGSGLGLHLSKEIVATHGGSIGFNTRPGHGTTFWFRLPALARLQVPPPRPARPAVLICDDNKDITQGLALLAEARGMEPHIAHSAGEAAALLSTRSFVAATVDVGLPDERGTRMLARLAARGVALPPIVILSGEPTSLADIPGVPLYAWLMKPQSSKAIVQAMLAASRRRDQGRPRVLHVEADGELRRVVGAMLGDRVEVVGAETLRAAASALAEGAFDAVVLEPSLPDGRGDLLVDRLAELQPCPPVVLFAGLDPGPALAGRVSALLVKTRDSEQRLVDTVLRLVSVDKAA